MRKREIPNEELRTSDCLGSEIVEHDFYKGDGEWKTSLIIRTGIDNEFELFELVSWIDKNRDWIEEQRKIYKNG